MSVMSASQMLTRADLDALPDDGLRHELIDGQFVMTPSPEWPHQSLSSTLGRLLGNACVGTGLKVLHAPFDVVLGANVVEPDLIVAPRAAFSTLGHDALPLLAVEILSPSTRRIDQGRKRELYEEFGVANYWIVDPDAPSVIVLQLVDGRYTEVGRAVDEETVTITRPVSLTFTPAELLRD